MKSTYALLIALILTIGVFGYILLSGDDEDTDVNTNDNVVTESNESDDSEVNATDEVDDSSDEEIETGDASEDNLFAPSDSDEVEEVQQEETTDSDPNSDGLFEPSGTEDGDDEEEGSESSQQLESTSRVGEARADDGARVEGYNYSVENGKLYFYWLVSEPTPVATVGGDGQVFEVTFESLEADFADRNIEDNTDLGRLLPTLTSSYTEGGEAVYTFEFEDQDTREFSISETTLDGDAAVVFVVDYL